jgi:hypothetical protein
MIEQSEKTVGAEKARSGSIGLDWIIREDHPYDRGYWARYDNKARPSGTEQRQGWDDCNRELRAERAVKQPGPRDGEQQREGT